MKRKIPLPSYKTKFNIYTKLMWVNCALNNSALIMIFCVIWLDHLLTKER